MINRQTIDRILDATRIDEVVGEFVTLKKRGVNLLGNCPFHNEKTPSFTVSPTKGIYKCFGCGKAGNSVQFLMEHEQYSYPEALRYLAGKYNIEIEEERITSDEAQQQANERESIYIVLNYAAQYFKTLLHEDEAGKTIGMSYFKERGFRDETMEAFGLGYCKDEWSDFTDHAIKAGYQLEFLQKAGLSKVNEQGKHFDLFKGRVLFPIHNLSGRVIAFGGRQLKTDAKSPKYLNSPESDVYHKSHIVYGIYHAKQAIRTEDVCYMAEGYTDVITLHQAGIKNVVASSGTSLTEQQIKLIGRFTKNITILYDGDAAGLKASLRGIDLVLAEGMNVRIVMFPDGEDPDSYCKKVGGEQFAEYIKANEQDFILFKSNLLLKEVNNDPVKKAEAIKDLVESISKIPDPIKRTIFVKECSRIMDIEEQILFLEISRIKKQPRKELEQKAAELHELDNAANHQPNEYVLEFKLQERDLIRTMMMFAGKPFDGEQSVIQFVTKSLEQDELSFDEPLHQTIYDLFKEKMAEDITPDLAFFTNHPDPEISGLAVELVSSNYEMSSNWEKKYDIPVKLPEENYRNDVQSAFCRFKLKKIQKLEAQNAQDLKNATTEDDILLCMKTQMFLQEQKQKVLEFAGTVILK